MNTYTSRLNEHHQTTLLLPWYLNQSLEPAERQLVEQHLQNCNDCKMELASLQLIADAVANGSNADFSPEESFSKLRAKLQSNRLPRERSNVVRFNIPANSNSASNRENSTLKKQLSQVAARYSKQIAIAASLFLVLIPVALQYRTSPEPSSYYTLSATKPEVVSDRLIRVVFSKTLAASDIDKLLEQVYGQRVEGPNSVGAYTVRLAPDANGLDLTTALASLRHQPGVVFAEPVQHP
ncbi:MAG: zf-HC2 domain-containing protein [Methylococcales bacterium]|nr:zf-HC2 domain-containing protein [Methylococcaceae bacterium]